MKRVFLLVALYCLSCSAATAQSIEELRNGANSPDQYKVKPTDDELTKLMKQRINIAFMENQHYSEARNAGLRPLGSTIASQNRLLKAKLEFHNKSEELKAAYEEALKAARETENVIIEMYKEGAGVSIQQVSEASYHRLDIEIQLAKFLAKGRK